MSAEEASDDLPPAATEEELEARHERELEEMEEKARSHVEAVAAAGGKSKKAKAAVEAAERETDQWLFELRERQKEEMERLRARLEGDTAPDQDAPARCTGDVASAPVEETEEERIFRKKAKALKKKQGRAAKEAERDAEKERERLEAGPSAREVELGTLTARLAKCRPPLRIMEVAADGNCLYRSIGDQLKRVRPDLLKKNSSREQDYEKVRAICAASLRTRMDDYAPFAELNAGEDYTSYCNRVENSADWGGELELRALADELRVRILVHRADANEPLAMGEAGGDGAPLHVAFHQHYYALGEHYNSVVPIEG